MNKVLLVTGGSRGIGAASALLAAQQGWAVAVNYTANSLAADEVVRQIRSAGGHAIAVQADVADEAQVLRMYEHIDAKLGRLSGLVNNAGVVDVYARVADMSVARLKRMFDINVMGSLICAREAVRRMSTRYGGEGGSIVNVSSAHALIGRKGMGLYDSTKAGMLAMTRTLAFEEVQHGVRVNAVCPGSTFTDFHIGRAVAAGKSPEQLKTERAGNSLMGRWAEPQEMAWPIVWLASDEASFITGATLMADGGLSIM